MRSINRPRGRSPDLDIRHRRQAIVGTDSIVLPTYVLWLNSQSNTPPGHRNASLGHSRGDSRRRMEFDAGTGADVPRVKNLDIDEDPISVFSFLTAGDSTDGPWSFPGPRRVPLPPQREIFKEEASRMPPPPPPAASFTIPAAPRLRGRGLCVVVLLLPNC